MVHVDSDTRLSSVMSWLLHGFMLHNLHCHLYTYLTYVHDSLVYLYILSAHVFLAHHHLCQVNECCVYDLTFLSLPLFVFFGVNIAFLFSMLSCTFVLLPVLECEFSS